MTPLICVVIFITICTAGANCTFSDKSRLNFLYLVVDDLRPALGCYGNEQVKSPNIDQLAAQSVRFNAAFAQQALCGPSRTSFLTSRRPDTTKLYDLSSSYWRKAAGNYTTLPQHLKDNGYTTVSLGKVFHPGRSSGHTDDYPYSWSVPPYHPPTLKYKNAKVCPGRDGELHANLLCPVNVKKQPGGSLPDIQIAERAVSTLANLSASQQPFFLAVGFHKPHVPFKFPREFLDLYPSGSALPPRDPLKPPGLPEVAWNPWESVRRRDDVQKLNVSFPYGPLPWDFGLDIIRHYHAATSYTDSLVGQVLSQLHSLGLASSTVVVLHADHGWQLGEHGEWAKFSNFQAAARVPLLLHVPGITTRAEHVAFPFIDVFRDPGRPGKRRGASSEELVELVDVFPSLVELAGLSPLPTCSPPPQVFKEILCTEGSSFVKSLWHAVGQKGNRTDGNRETGKQAVFYQYPRPSEVPQENSDEPHLRDIKVMGYTIRKRTARYTEWVGFDPATFSVSWDEVHGWELYDLEMDPGEDMNFVDSLKYRGLRDKLSKELRLGWRHARR